MAAAKIEQWPLAKIKPYPNNPRSISDKAIAKVAASIREFGFQQPIVVDPHGVVIAGHARLKAAVHLDLKTVPVVVADLPEPKARAYRLADNRTHQETDWLDELLKDELGALKELDFDLSLTGFDDRELDLLLAGAKSRQEREDDIPDPPATPITKPGDVWKLGRHRLVCGDSSQEQICELALDGKQPDLVVYDPPYDKADTWTWIVPAKKALVFTDYKRVREAVATLKNYAVVYQFVWDGVTSWYTKNRPLMRHKTCLFGAHEEGWNFDEAVYYDGKERTAKVVSNTRGATAYKPLGNGAVHLQTVFQQQNTKVEGGHAHAKPVQWVRALMLGAGGTCVLDQFAGSGTTFIAAPAGTTVGSVELDPATCDVAIERWQQVTGEPARRL